jgi:flagellin
MSVINTNISGQVAVNAITKNDREQELAMERLSTGMRINSAKDDAAGLAITERMKAEVSGLEMATRNANDAISMLETAEGSTREIASALQRMRELAVQAASGTYSDTDRLALDLEFGELWLEMQRIATQTTWNTMTVLNGGNDLQTAAVTKTVVNIQLGKSASQTMTLNLRSWDPQTAIRAAQTIALTSSGAGSSVNNGATVATPAGTTGFDGLGNDNHTANATAAAGSPARETETQAYGSAVLYVGDTDGVAGAPDVPGRINIKIAANATYALTQLDIAISAVSAERAMYGSYIGRLQAASDNLINVAQNQDQSRSRIEDTDYAVETSELSRTQIIAQASTAMLAQANQSKQTVLALLQ